MTEQLASAVPPASGTMTLGLRGYESAITQAYAPMVLEPEVPGARYEWAVTGQRCGMLGMSHIVAEGEIRARVPQAARTPDERRVILTFVQRGCFEFEQAGRRAQCGPASLVLMNAGAPLEASQHGALEILSFILPTEFLQARIPDLPRFFTIARPATQGSAAILRDLMQSLWRENRSLEHDEARALPGILATLIESVFVRDEASLAQEGQQAALFQRLQDVIHEEAHNPALTPLLIANRLGISVSYLFTLARRFGISIRQSIIEHRLEACSRMLADPSCARRSITEIAFLWGFQDVSHFSRRFSARYGVSPRAYRELAVGRAAPYTE